MFATAELSETLTIAHNPKLGITLEAEGLGLPQVTIFGFKLPLDWYRPS